MAVPTAIMLIKTECIHGREFAIRAGPTPWPAPHRSSWEHDADVGGVSVFLGMDVSKAAHHGHGLIPAGNRVFDKQLPISERFQCGH
ncbi:hypothetical protein ACFWDQ_34560 [Streptomyces sp. NPDC060053]|uniref:hypothetical protein n=1 Tax=Streptomyces sp. NPDC060053 TaxID=3347047 RepID=UPI00369EED46